MAVIPKQFPCDLPICPNRPDITKHFKSAEDLKLFIEMQEKVWKGLEGVENYPAKGSDPIETMRRALRPVVESGRAYFDNVNADTLEIFILRAFEALKSRVVVVSDSPNGKVVAGLEKINKFSAIAAFRYFQNNEIVNNLPHSVFQGAFAAAISDNLGKNDVAIAMVDWFDKEFAKLAEMVSSYKGKIDKFDVERQQQNQDIENLLAIEKQKLKKLETTYNEKLALQAPSRYWIIQKDKAKCTVWWMGAAMICTVVLSLGGIFLLRYLTPLDFSNTGGIDWTIVVYEHVAPIALIVALAFWLLKLFGRILLSNLHMSADAGERAVMISTFLSLQRRNKASADDLSHLLTAIFKPTSTGLLHENAVPNQAVDVNVGKAIGS